MSVYYLEETKGISVHVRLLLISHQSDDVYVV
jgi:hypothetical protein